MELGCSFYFFLEGFLKYFFKNHVAWNRIASLTNYLFALGERLGSQAKWVPTPGELYSLKERIEVFKHFPSRLTWHGVTQGVNHVDIWITRCARKFNVRPQNIYHISKFLCSLHSLIKPSIIKLSPLWRVLIALSEVMTPTW